MPNNITILTLLIQHNEVNYPNKINPSQLGLDRFTLNRFLPIPILTDFETFNITDTDTDSVEKITYRYRYRFFTSL
jgi:hypothetical protein